MLLADSAHPHWRTRDVNPLRRRQTRAQDTRNISWPSTRSESFASTCGASCRRCVSRCAADRCEFHRRSPLTAALQPDQQLVIIKIYNWGRPFCTFFHQIILFHSPFTKFSFLYSFTVPRQPQSACFTVSLLAISSTQSNLFAIKRNRKESGPRRHLLSSELAAPVSPSNEVDEN